MWAFRKQQVNCNVSRNLERERSLGTNRLSSLGHVLPSLLSVLMRLLSQSQRQENLRSSKVRSGNASKCQEWVHMPPNTLNSLENVDWPYGKSKLQNSLYRVFSVCNLTLLAAWDQVGEGCLPMCYLWLSEGAEKIIPGNFNFLSGVFPNFPQWTSITFYEQEMKKPFLKAGSLTHAPCHAW